MNLAPFMVAATLFAAQLSPNFASAQTITTVAGGGSPTTGNISNFAMSDPAAIVFDKNGNYYVANNGDGSIRKVSPAGMVTTVAGNNSSTPIADGALATSGVFIGLTGMVMDASDNIYVTEFTGNKIRKIDPSGIVSTVAGTGVAGYNGDGIPATSAKLNWPLGLALDGVGNLFVAEVTNHRVRKITPGGIISTVAGTGVAGYNGDGIAAIGAQLNQPEAVAFDGANNLYITENGGARVRMISPAGIISTVAGNGSPGSSGDGGPAIDAKIWPAGINIDAAGNVMVTTNDGYIRKISSNGIITTIAGTTAGYGGDNGPATSARLNGPLGIAFDGAGEIFVADEYNFRVRKIDNAGIITTVAGDGSALHGVNGPATAAVLSGPVSVHVDHAGNIYFPDVNRILKVDTAGLLRLIAGTGVTGSTGDGGPAVSANINAPFSVYADNAGSVYFGCTGDYRIRKVDSLGIITTFAGNGTPGNTGDGGLAVSAQIGRVRGITGDASGNIYFTDMDNAVVRRVQPSGVITRYAGSGTRGFSGDGGPATSAQLGSPRDIAIDAAGNIYVADNAPNTVRKIDPSGIITTVAGSNTSTLNDTGDGGPATSALFFDLEGLSSDVAGNLFITDPTGMRVRRIDAGTGIISAFAGSWRLGFAGDGGPALSAQLSTPYTTALDVHGNVYIADLGNQRIRKVTMPYTLPNFNTTVTQAVSGSFSSDVNDNSFHRIVTITPGSGANALAGNVTFTQTVDPSIQSYNGHPYLTRHYDITPAINASTAQATVTLYFSQADFDAYNSYVTGNSLGLPPLPSDGSDGTNMANITILQFHGTGTTPADYTGGLETIVPAVSYNSSNNWWEISFPVNGFSGFFLTSGANPLPLHLLSFTGLLQGSIVTLKWETTNEKGVKLFGIERSSDARDFVSIGSVPSQNTAGANSYRYIDGSASAGTLYYRLRMQDADGKYTYSNVISVNLGISVRGMQIYPNPVQDRLFVQLQSAQTEKTVVRLVNMEGKVLLQQDLTLNNGINAFSLDTRQLAAGTYFITIAGSQPRIRQFVKS